MRIVFRPQALLLGKWIDLPPIRCPDPALAILQSQAKARKCQIRFSSATIDNRPEWKR